MSDPSESTNLKVGVRVRPLSQKEIMSGAVEAVRVIAGKTINILEQGRDERNFSFDHVFDPTCAQDTVFKSMAENLCVDVCLGKNATVFAYGATGSGKTHTMLGTADTPGVMIQTLESLFQLTESPEYRESFSFHITVSFLEIYNETVRDLLTDDPRGKGKGLEIREDKKEGVYVEGAIEKKATTVMEVIALLQEGNLRRTTEATNANQTSSRSHAVLQITVQRYTKGMGMGVVDRKAKLSLIDLAGSEKSSATAGAVKTRQVEGANINKSLLALANCINKLGQLKEDEKDKSFVNYRDSKLTRLLKESLGGNCKTVMIAAISPSNQCIEETINTLKYANRAKNIKTHVVENRLNDSQFSEYESIIANLRSQVASLRHRIANDDMTMSVEDMMVEMKLDTKVVARIDPHSMLKKDVNTNFLQRMQIRRLFEELDQRNSLHVASLKTKLQLLDLLQSDKTPLKELSNEQLADLSNVSMDIDDLRDEIKANLKMMFVLKGELVRRFQEADYLIDECNEIEEQEMQAFATVNEFSQSLEQEVLDLMQQLSAKDAIIAELVLLLYTTKLSDKLDPHVMQLVHSRTYNRIITPIESNEKDAWQWQKASFQPVYTSSLLERTFIGPAKARSCTWSPDNTSVAAAFSNGVVIIWNVPPARSERPEIYFKAHSAPVNFISFSPDGSLIMTASDDETIKLWEVETLNEVAQLISHSGPVEMAVFSPDGREILSCSHDETLKLWQAGVLTPVRTFEGHDGFVLSCDFSPTHQTCVSASDDRTVRLWDLLTGDQLMSFTGHEGSVYRSVFSSDGSMLCSAGDDWSIRLWDLREASEVAIFSGHGEGVHDCALFSSGAHVVSCSSDFTIRVWDCSNGAVVRCLEGHADVVNSVSISRDGTMLVTASDDGTVRVWRVDRHVEKEKEKQKTAVSSALPPPSVKQKKPVPVIAKKTK